MKEVEKVRLLVLSAKKKPTLAATRNYPAPYPSPSLIHLSDTSLPPSNVFNQLRILDKVKDLLMVAPAQHFAGSL